MRFSLLFSLLVSGALVPWGASALEDGAPAKKPLTLAEIAASAGGNAIKVSLTPDDALSMAEDLFKKGELAEAEAILRSFANAPPENIDVDRMAFLTGLLAAQKGDMQAAVDIFRSILARKPELVRVRLELARVLFEVKDDGPSAYHFRLALSGDLPDDVKNTVRGYLRQIEARKTFYVRFSAGLVPNSNINTGPNDTTVRLFGLVPFDLSEDARQTSGIGVSSSLSVTALPKITDNWRLEATGAVRALDYENIAFDDVFLSLEAGPRFDGKRLKASFLATASERYFAGDRLTTTFGSRLVLTTPLAQRTRFSVRASYAEADYHNTDNQDGPIYGGGITLSQSLNRRSFAGGSLQLTRQETEAETLRNTQYAISLFYSRELPYGITARVSPQYVYRPFEAAAAINNGVTRLDRLYGVSLDLTKRDLSWYGFAPIVSYSYLHNTSTIELFEYDQHRVNLGLTRIF